LLITDINSQLPWLLAPEGQQRLVPTPTVIWGWRAATHTPKVMTDGQGKPHQRVEGFQQSALLSYISVSTVHRGCPHTANSPVCSDWKN